MLLNVVMLVNVVLFAGVVLAAVLASYIGRLVCRDPVYHGLSKLKRQSAPRR